jgi:hypothetical protein
MYHLLRGANFASADGHFQFLKHTHTTSGAATRRRNALLVLLKKPKRYGELRSARNRRKERVWDKQAHQTRTPFKLRLLNQYPPR